MRIDQPLTEINDNNKIRNKIAIKNKKQAVICRTKKIKILERKSDFIPQL